MKYTISSILLCLILVSCKKEKEYNVVLPLETVIGENSLGFLYNGTSVWSSIEHGIFFLNDQPDDITNATATIFTESDSSKTLQFGGEMKIKNNSAAITSNSFIQFTIQNYNFTTGNFYFDTSSLRSSWTTFQNVLTSKNYYNYANRDFSVVITKIDTVQKTVSGKFSGNLFLKNGSTFFLNDSIKVEQGRFDIKYEMH